MTRTDSKHQESSSWFVMRDLKRPNAKSPAYKYLAELGFEVFTPMKLKVSDKGFRRVREYVPYLPDLLFVRAVKSDLDKIVVRTDTLQYRFAKGQGYGVPMTVPTQEMDQFIAAVGKSTDTIYYNIDQITPEMAGCRVRIVCDGPLNSFEGNILKIKGSRKKRILVKLEGLLAAAVELKSGDTVEVIEPEDQIKEPRQ